MSASGRPRHLWIVAIVTFGLYLGGARDYLLILVHDTDYMLRQFGPGGIGYFTDYPLALRILWVINIIGGLATPVLLLALSRWASPAAVATLTTQGLLLIVTFAFRDRWNALGAATAWFDIGITLVTVLVVWYCWAMRRRGVLR
jgi:O-antigen/teichoic acid export membrane protein